MTDVEATTAELLAEKPGLEDGLEDLLDVDAERETWTFEDVPFDSGTFGELVSRGIVEKQDGEYTIADRAAVGRALGVEQDPDADTARDANGDSAGNFFENVSMPDLRVDRPVATLGLVGALALVVLFRLLPWPAVFRGENVVLSGNDPYAYRYVVTQLVETSTGPLDFSMLSSLPSGMEHGEPLMVGTLAWISTLFGGASAVGGVLAWFPVVSAVVTALLVYVLAVRLTEDRRVGIAAVALLAIMPGHAFRTGLGFADHHAFDYPWLALTALAVVSLIGRDAPDRGDWRTWAWRLALGVGVAGQTLAWDAGPLLLVPLGLFVAGAVPSWVRAGRSPAREAAGVIAGLALAAVVVLLVHTQWGWHTRVVSLAPVLLLGGSVVLVTLGEAARRFDVPARMLVGVEAVVGVGGFAAIWTLFPDFADELGRGVDFLITTGGIAETTSIVSGDLGTFVGPIFLFGFALFVALPYMGWAIWRWYRADEVRWLAVGVYGWYFLILSVVQIRFAGQLALFAAVFGGLGFVHLAGWVDLADYPRPFEGGEDERERRLASSEEDGEGPDDLEWPERRRALSLLGLGLGVGSLGIINTPIKHSQLLIDESMYDAARFMREYSAERDWEYPENYVFSEWGRNRVYNWFVNGESQSYRYAQEYFQEFLQSTSEQEWYDKLSNENKAGFVVLDETTNSERGTIQHLLSSQIGNGTSHFRLIGSTKEGSKLIYQPVKGAILAGQADPDSTISVHSEISIGDRMIQYRNQNATTQNGWYAVTVPYPGNFTGPNTSFDVSESAVVNGHFVGETTNTAHWTLEAGTGNVAFDIAGGHHGHIQGATWVTRDNRQGLSFEGTGGVYTQSSEMDFKDGMTVLAWVRLTNKSDNWPVAVAKGPSPQLGDARHTFALRNDAGREFRYSITVDDSRSFITEELPLDEWVQIGLTWGKGEFRAYLNGNIIGQRSVNGSLLANSAPITIGQLAGRNSWYGQIGEVYVAQRTFSVEEVKNRYQDTLA